MISIIIIIKSLEIDDCINSVLNQNYEDREIILVINNSNQTLLQKIKKYENTHENIKIIVNNVSEDNHISQNIGLNYAQGEYVLFLSSNQKLNNENVLNIYLENIEKNNDFLISFNDKNMNNTWIEFIGIANNNYSILFLKSFLTENNIKFYNANYFMNKELFLLTCISFSNNFKILNEKMIHEVSSQESPQKSNLELNIALYYSVINNFLDNEKIYGDYYKYVWNIIFNNIFDLIYNLRDETTKRNYFKDSKLLFDEYCFNQGYYDDIHNSLDIMTLEFYKQTLDEVYYSPIKRNVSRRLVNENFGPLKIAIKTPNPIEDRTYGDYFFAIALKKSFEKRGFKVVIHELQNWYSEEDNEDIVIVLRGLAKYIPKSEHINIMWNISHPEAVSMEEYNSYDVVFISSIKFSNEMNKKVDTLVKPLLQCTDPDIFHPKFNENYSEDILFVGKTRKVFRTIIKDISNTPHNFAVYGEGWEEYIDKKFIKGDFIPNNILNQYYSSCKILLNDHWEEMRELDFPSNRLFDALACGAFVISDEIPSANSIFENNIVTYKNSNDLDEKIKYYLNNTEERNKMRKKGRELVLTKHTFDNRADEIIETLKNINF